MYRYITWSALGRSYRLDLKEKELMIKKLTADMKSKGTWMDSNGNQHG